MICKWEIEFIYNVCLQSTYTKVPKISNAIKLHSNYANIAHPYVKVHRSKPFENALHNTFQKFKEGKCGFRT